ncbi:unnamed protein product [Phytomonas sp. EM1]|nr:unnamed protein product [Phytomonas sp. EM1]|eukprot:CCW63098.1 unnamed protein product [Phytomonas sp. isolate EM1]
MTPNGGAMGEAVRMLGYTPYIFETTFRKGNLQTHPKEWCMVLNQQKKFDTAILEVPQTAKSPKDSTRIQKDGEASSPPQEVASYDAIVGPPATLAYESILQECPRSTKVVLVEEPDKLFWEKEYDAMLQPILDKTQRLQRRIGLGDLHSMLVCMTDLRKATSARVTRGLSTSTTSPLLHTPALRLASALDLFEARVKDVVPRDRLLIYREGEGWGPLCAFLRVPVPTTASGESCPFPPHDSGIDVLADLNEKFHRISVLIFVVVVLAVTSFIALGSSVRTRMGLFMEHYYNRFRKEMDPFLKSDDQNSESEGSKTSLRRKLIEAKKVTLKFENEIREEGGAMSSIKDVFRALFNPEEVVQHNKLGKSKQHVADPDSTCKST